jgi:L-aspartate oxidase
MIVRCALQRHESRGLHYTLDHPETSDEIRDTVLTPPVFIASSPLVLNSEVPS